MLTGEEGEVNEIVGAWLTGGGDGEGGGGLVTVTVQATVLL